MKPKFLYQVVMLMTLLAITACNKKSDNLLNCVPADADMVGIFHPKSVIISAGGEINDSQIELPTSLTDLTNDFDKINDFLKNSGLDLNTAVSVLNRFDDEEPIFIFKINDRKAFIDKIEEFDFNHEKDIDGIKFYKCNVGDYSTTYIALNGDIGYCIDGIWNEKNSEGIKRIQKMIKRAANKSFDSTPFCKYISEGNTGGICINIPKELRQAVGDQGMPPYVSQMLKGRVCINCDIESDKAKMTLKVLDENGKDFDVSAISKLIDLNATISSEALSYLGNNEQLVAAIALKDVDWDAYFDLLGDAMNLRPSERATFSVIRGYLEKIDGTLAYGVGVTDGLESVAQISCQNDILENISMTLVVETQDGKAKGMMRDIRDLLVSLNMPIEENKNGFMLDLFNQGTIYGEVKDDFVIIATHPIVKTSDNITVQDVKFSHYFGGMGLALPRTTKLMEDLDLDFDIKAYMVSIPKQSTTEMVIEIKGGPDGFIAKIIDLSSQINYNYRKFIKRIDDINEEKWNSRYNY